MASAGLSPGRFALRAAKANDRKRAADTVRKSQPAFKFRRLTLGGLAASTSCASEVRDGLQYSPNMGILNPGAPLDTTIPPFEPDPKIKRLASEHTYDEVIFDIETTELSGKNMNTR